MSPGKFLVSKRDELVEETKKSFLDLTECKTQLVGILKTSEKESQDTFGGMVGDFSKCQAFSSSLLFAPDTKEQDIMTNVYALSNAPVMDEKLKELNDSCVHFEDLIGRTFHNVSTQNDQNGVEAITTEILNLRNTFESSADNDDPSLLKNFGAIEKSFDNLLLTQKANKVFLTKKNNSCKSNLENAGRNAKK